MQTTEASKSNQPVSQSPKVATFFQPSIQTKQLINNPNDSYEQEADATAEKIMRMEAPGNPKPFFAPASDLQRCGCNKEEQIQKKAAADSTNTNIVASPAVLKTLSSSGHSMDVNTRNLMESRFGHDFGSIRIHTDQLAQQSSADINARAYTSGNHIVFGAGEYQPTSAEGKKLLAHEITHTIQQGPHSNSIQRSVKIEIQTSNYLWALDPRTNTPEYVKRKLGSEDGSKPGFVATGKHGEEARQKAVSRLIEWETPLVTEADTKSIYPLGQYIKKYQVSGKVTFGKRPAKNQLKLISELNLENFKDMQGWYEPKGFTYVYSDADGKNLDIHVDENGLFQVGHNEVLKVGRMSADRNAEYERSYTFKNVTVEKDIIGKRVADFKLTIKKNLKNKKPFFPETVELRYFNKDGSELMIHEDENGNWEKGHIKYAKKTLLEKNEQTAMELQPEDHGFIEFETPKWFRSLKDLKLRIQDAVDMTKKISAGTVVTDTAILEKFKEIKKTNNRNPHQLLGTIVEWPAHAADFKTDYTHVKAALPNKKVYAELIPDVSSKWRAFFQISEGIELSRYPAMLKQWDSVPGDSSSSRPAISSFVSLYVKNIIEKITSQKNIKPRSNKSLGDLNGFIQLMVSYVIWGQYFPYKGHKDTFVTMARTDFGSMYNSLLDKEEQELYQLIIGKKRDLSDNMILTKELEDKINELKAGSPTAGLTSFNRHTQFYLPGAEVNPTIISWMREIAQGKDLLTGVSVQKVGDAIGGRKVVTEIGDKDYKLALFEQRRGKTLPADKWVDYVTKVFQIGMQRSSDTPDDPTTAVNESAKTSLKD